MHALYLLRGNIYKRIIKSNGKQFLRLKIREWKPGK
jgi:hypothetical protein